MIESESVFGSLCVSLSGSYSVSVSFSVSVSVGPLSKMNVKKQWQRSRGGALPI